jgi:iron(III) transport system ATP-binding protein
MQKGYLLQWDVPYHIYHYPSHRFVASFIGNSRWVRGELHPDGSISTPFGPLECAHQCVRPFQTGDVEILIRPDDFIPASDGPYTAEVIHSRFQGAEILYTLRLQGECEILCLAPSHQRYAIGSNLRLRSDLADLVLFPVEER